MSHLEQNVRAVDMDLTQAEKVRLEEIFAIGAGAGARYMPNALKGMGL